MQVIVDFLHRAHTVLTLITYASYCRIFLHRAHTVLTIITYASYCRIFYIEHIRY